MRKLLLAAPVLALTTGCLGPPGNALGLEGEYVGTLKSDISGAITQYNGGQTTNATIEAIVDNRGIITLERGYGDVDALLTGLGCPALLVASGQQLTLMEDAECESVTDTTTKVGAQSVNKENTETTVVTEVTVTPNGPGSIKLKALIERDTEERQNDQRVQTTSVEVEYDFTGILVGGE